VRPSRHGSGFATGPREYTDEVPLSSNLARRHFRPVPDPRKLRSRNLPVLAAGGFCRLGRSPPWPWGIGFPPGRQSPGNRLIPEQRAHLPVREMAQTPLAIRTKPPRRGRLDDGGVRAVRPGGYKEQASDLLDVVPLSSEASHRLTEDVLARRATRRTPNRRWVTDP
jgi:hypothetical protein